MILWTASCSAWLTCSGVSPPPAAWNVFSSAVDGVEVVGQVEDLGDVGVALVAVGDEADLQVGRRLAAGDLVADGPDLRLGPVDQAAHAAGRVEAEDDLDLGLLGGAAWPEVSRQTAAVAVRAANARAALACNE